eukprot:gb/GFBE01000112.1/.p1 GENE.gb/GFBE01000112.1/~~gb/GFBE01000112.1/.p1  ORF type:complete len:728 (+),score=143.16 gb/GFBE01000112.1/:1-2184(+)
MLPVPGGYAGQPGYVVGQARRGSAPAVGGGYGLSPRGYAAPAVVYSGANTGQKVVQLPIAPQQPVHYIYKGQRYSDYAALQAACMQPTPRRANRDLKDILKDGPALEERIMELFREYAGADQRLDQREMQGLALSLAAALGVDRSAFGDIDMMFHRYDFSGDGHLDDSEARHLVKHMLRVYRDGTPESPSKRKTPPDFTADTIPTKQLAEFYILGKKLGQGGQGAVYLATDKACRQQRVVKFYDKGCAAAPVDDIVDEFKLLASLDHPKIARLYEVFQDYAYIYVVSEPYFGGDLTTCGQKASEKGVKLTQSWLAGILRQVCAGVKYLHDQKQMHCDLKEANVMISGDSDWHAPNVVVIDFGLARDFKTPGPGSPFGTPGYMPPEVWHKGLWTPKGDIFCLGVIFYQLHCLQMRRVFQGQTIDELKASTCAMAIDFQPLSNAPPFQRMVQSMLVQDFRMRPTVREVLERSWWTDVGKDGSEPISAEGIANLGGAGKRRNSLRTALMMDVVATENLAHLKELNDLFASLDKDLSGSITEAEARQALTGKMAPAQVDQLISALIGESGAVTYSNFMAQMIAAKKADDTELLWRLFKELDADNNNYLDTNELHVMLQRPKVKEILGSRTAAEVMSKMDADGSGNVTFFEFKRAMMQDDSASAAAPEQRRHSAPVGGSLRAGQKVRYYSASFSQWMETTVTAVDPNGSIQLECKPGYWMPPAEQSSKVRTA